MCEALQPVPCTEFQSCIPENLTWLYFQHDPVSLDFHFGGLQKNLSAELTEVRTGCLQVQLSRSFLLQAEGIRV